MAERFADAALRHLETAEVLEIAGRIDDAAYHYGLVGEMSIKAAAVRVLGMPLPPPLHKHINHGRGQTLQTAVMRHAQILSALTAGRLGGALRAEIAAATLQARFPNWSLNIRYADSTHCPVLPTSVSQWKSDALVLYNAGAF